MQKILAISGRMQSGKSSASNFIHGWELRQKGIISYFDIDDDTGELIVNARVLDSEGKEGDGYGCLDVLRSDYHFYEYAAQNIWPFVKAYNFADNLKISCMKIFGVSRESLYGTNEQKQAKTNIKWSALNFFLPTVLKKELKESCKLDDFLTGRELLQKFGELCRKIQPNCWSSSCLRQIIGEQVPLAIIGDCRFPNEVEDVHAVGGKVLRLLANKFPDDKHESEIALDDYPLENYDAVIDNRELSIRDKNIAIFAVLKSWGWIDGELRSEV